MTTKKMEFRLEKALDNLIEQDKYLIENDLNERSISHHLAIHIQNKFPGWHVDCEYNRDINKVKTIAFEVPEAAANQTEARTVYPDIIIHKRGVENNLAVIEMKKSNNQDSGEYDIRKLAGFKNDLNYNFAYFVLIDIDKTDYTITSH